MISKCETIRCMISQCYDLTCGYETEGLPMSQYTYSFTSELSNQIIALIAPVRFSKKSQKHRNATPRFQLWRTKLVKRTSSSSAAARRLAAGYRGYVGSAARMAPGLYYRCQPGMRPPYTPGLAHQEVQPAFYHHKEGESPRIGELMLLNLIMSGCRCSSMQRCRQASLDAVHTNEHWIARLNVSIGGEPRGNRKKPSKQVTVETPVARVTTRNTTPFPENGQHTHVLL